MQFRGVSIEYNNWRVFSFGFLFYFVFILYFRLIFCYILLYSIIHSSKHLINAQIIRHKTHKSSKISVKQFCCSIVASIYHWIDFQKSFCFRFKSFCLPFYIVFWFVGQNILLLDNKNFWIIGIIIDSIGKTSVLLIQFSINNNKIYFSVFLLHSVIVCLHLICLNSCAIGCT